jgi:N-dimethylarginine dimethylaminohydrolase
MVEWGVDSEVKPLKSIAVHTPTVEELERIRQNPRENLFVAPPDVQKAIKQHSEFVGVLREEGVKVFDIPSLSGMMRPNLVFCRDLAVVTKKGAIICNFALPSRRGEENVVRQFFEMLGIPIIFDISKQHPDLPFEGGDLVFINEEVVAIGESERTVPAIREFFSQLGIFKRILAFPLSKGFIHLDTVFTMIDEHVCLSYIPVLPDRVIKELQVLNVKLISVSSWKELGNLAANVLTLRPGRVISAAENPETNSNLKRYGIDVIEVELSEFLKGLGGPRCLTLPLAR